MIEYQGYIALVNLAQLRRFGENLPSVPRMVLAVFASSDWASSESRLPAFGERLTITSLGRLFTFRPYAARGADYMVVVCQYMTEASMLSGKYEADVALLNGAYRAVEELDDRPIDHQMKALVAIL